MTHQLLHLYCLLFFEATCRMASCLRSNTALLLEDEINGKQKNDQSVDEPSCAQERLLLKVYGSDMGDQLGPFGESHGISTAFPATKKWRDVISRYFDDQMVESVARRRVTSFDPGMLNDREKHRRCGAFGL
jgi:hypothetical protein